MYRKKNKPYICRPFLKPFVTRTRETSKTNRKCPRKNHNHYIDKCKIKEFVLLNLTHMSVTRKKVKENKLTKKKPFSSF